MKTETLRVDEVRTVWSAIELANLLYDHVGIRLPGAPELTFEALPDNGGFVLVQRIRSYAPLSEGARGVLVVRAPQVNYD